jgi:hypothetical protein
MPNPFYLYILFLAKIWLNCLLDDCHLSYITTMKWKTLDLTSRQNGRNCNIVIIIISSSQAHLRTGGRQSHLQLHRIHHNHDP